MKKHNFYAGPSILPEYTIKNTADAVLNFAGTGLSILEVSHRSKEFVAVMDDAIKLFKELLDVPAGYQVIFVGGGAWRIKRPYGGVYVRSYMTLANAKCFVEKRLGY